MNFDWDYITIGSNGFAQVGRPEYWEKQLSEKAVLVKHMKDNFPVPDDLRHLCFYQWKSFPHDFGTYHELVLCYDRFFFDHIEECATEDEASLPDRFYEFVNACESESLETEAFTEAIRHYYEEHYVQDIEPVPIQFPESPEIKDYLRDNLDVLGLGRKEQELIEQIHSGHLDPSTFESCKRWIDQCYNRPTDDELRMCAYNEILEGYGIEAHFGEWKNGYWCDVEFTYVNLGDSYSFTIIHHRDRGWMVGTVADLLESVS